MPIHINSYKEITHALQLQGVQLVAVSKTKPVEDILELYELGHRDFGENYVQELLDKQSRLPADIRWHFIGHLQSNKVKQIAPFVQLIQGVDSLKLLEEVNKQGNRVNRIINCLLQVHIAEEETKFGFSPEELSTIFDGFDVLTGRLPFVRIQGLMGMASFTGNADKFRKEFRLLKALFDKQPSLSILSMGMSQDYQIAMEEGSNMVRIGGLLFGERS